MEPMVLGGLGIVVYWGYLTVKDLVSDLRQEGLIPSSNLASGWLRGVVSLSHAKAVSQRARHAGGAFICSPVLARTGEHQPVAGRLYRSGSW
jgi:hypothetical protein